MNIATPARIAKHAAGAPLRPISVRADPSSVGSKASDIDHNANTRSDKRGTLQLSGAGAGVRRSTPRYREPPVCVHIRCLCPKFEALRVHVFASRRGCYTTHSVIETRAIETKRVVR